MLLHSEVQSRWQGAHALQLSPPLALPTALRPYPFPPLQANENIMPERPRGRRGGDYLALPGGQSGGGQYALQQYGGAQAGRPPPPPGPYPGGQQAPGYVDPAVLAAVGQADLRFGF